MAVVTVLTDFGPDDYYVAAVKGVLLSRAPGAVLVDVSHTVAPGDVEAAAFLLAATAPLFPAGTVHLAVVDPGVGSDRRLLAGDGPAGRFVAPDNGLLTPLAAGLDLYAVERGELFRRAAGSTFHGRDRFAPVAAALARGVRPEALGPPCRDPVLLDLPRPRRRRQELSGRVAHVDRFGNLVTDLPTGWLGERPFVAEVAGRRVERRADHYAELADGEAAVLPGSLGTLELAVRGASLAARWSVERGAPVAIRFR